MKKREIIFSITNLIPTGFMIGLSFHGADDKFDYNEINLYLGFIGFHVEY